jgi:DNA-binding MarR family transcriptional regulator
MTTMASLVARAAQLLNQGHVALAKDFRLSPTEERVLVALANHDGEQMSQLGQYAVVKQGTLSKAVDGLERKRLVERVKADDDRRRCLVRLSKDGGDVAGRLLCCARRRWAVLYRGLGAADVQKLEAALSRLNSVLDDIARGKPALDPIAAPVLPPINDGGDEARKGFAR